MYPMLTNEEFHAWCKTNAISPVTEAYIQRIRASQPVRKVRSGGSSITGRYPSVKMGHTIQFESFVELGAIYLMERDNEVLEFYDQPTRLQLHYHAKSGRLTTQWHTPDFLVVRRNAIGFDEWKAETALAPLAQRMPERYQQVAGGGWRCPPGEEATQGVGLLYRVRSSDEYHPLFLQNLKFLQDFWVHPYPVTTEQEVHVTTLLATVPGISLSQLLEASPDLPVDVVFALLANSRIFTLLSSASLMQRDHVVLYLSPEEAELGLIQQTSTPRPLPLFRHLRFDGRLWEAETQGETVSLRPEVGLSIQISTSSLEHLLATRQAQEVADTTPSTLSEETRALLLAAGPKAGHGNNLINFPGERILWA
jgi:putative transposase